MIKILVFVGENEVVCKIEDEISSKFCTNKVWSITNFKQFLDTFSTKELKYQIPLKHMTFFF